ncbi:MAG TPA: hypothetical protein VNQ73_07870 [Ilumatobacter sp.]|nr:hypothetical protein [Ilumatobacter sp.]
MALRDLAPTATTLRLRAGELRRFAAAIERCSVFDLDVDPDPTGDPAAPRRLQLCRRMLAANLQQLLAAADELREVAWQYDTRAHHLDNRPHGPHGFTVA